MPRSKKHRASADELAAIKARREARAGGYEYRPTTAAKQDEAERLNAGLSMMEDDAHEDAEGSED